VHRSTLRRREGRRFLSSLLARALRPVGVRRIRDHPTNRHPPVAAAAVLPGPEPTHCSREAVPVPPERFRRPRKDRPPPEEELAAAEGTSAADAVAGAAIGRKDCSAGSTRPVLPFPDPMAVAAERVHRRDPCLRRELPRAVRRRGFRTPEERRRGFRPAEVRLLGRRTGWEMPVGLPEERPEASPQAGMEPVLHIPQRGRRLRQVPVVAAEEQGAGRTCWQRVLVAEEPVAGRTCRLEPDAGRTRPSVVVAAVVLEKEEEVLGADRTCPFHPSSVAAAVAVVLGEERPGVGRTCPSRPSVVVDPSVVADPSCPCPCPSPCPSAAAAAAVAAVVAGKCSSPVCSPWEQGAEPGRRRRPIRTDFSDPHQAVRHPVHPRAMPPERLRQIGRKDCS